MASKIIGGVLLAMLMLVAATNAEAIIVICFGSAGLVNGVQTAQINVVRLESPEPHLFCPATLTFLDSHGDVIGQPTEVVFTRAGEMLSAAFMGNPDVRIGVRLHIRAEAAIGNPDSSPGCRGSFVATLELIDRLTRKTDVIQSLPIVRQ
jgi:hypothetical protein